MTAYIWHLHFQIRLNEKLTWDLGYLLALFGLCGMSIGTIRMCLV